MKNEIKAELDELTRKGIIRKINEPTDYVLMNLRTKVLNRSAKAMASYEYAKAQRV